MPKVRSDWPAQDVELLVTMRKQGASFREIADVLGKTCDQVKCYVRIRREELEIEPVQKQPSHHNRGRLGKGFDHEWLGGMQPFHWAMTKPWGNNHAK
jgi:hypothetical protein